jgi:Leucine-rich repeat (LRR) protein
LVDGESDANQDGVPDYEWINMDNWMTDKGICMWYGVTCPPLLHGGVEETIYNGNSDVIHLNLTENNIRGTIPPEIAALESLITLDLGRNNLEGTIPNTIATMEDLSKYQESVMNVPAHECVLIFAIWSTAEIYLEENELTGTLSAEFGMLHGLKEFFVGTNRLTGTIPAELNQLTGLRALGLDENFFTGTIPFLFDLKELRKSLPCLSPPML